MGWKLLNIITFEGLPFEKLDWVRAVSDKINAHLCICGREKWRPKFPFKRNLHFNKKIIFKSQEITVTVNSV